MKKLIIFSTMVICILSIIFLNTHIKSHNYNLKISDLKDKMVNLVTEPVYAASACITNCHLHLALYDNCISTVSVSLPPGCFLYNTNQYDYFGTCILATECDTSGGGDGGIITATLVNNCCGPRDIGTITIKCSDGSSDTVDLRIPPSARSASFRVSRKCPPCQLFLCVSNVKPCTNQQ